MAEKSLKKKTGKETQRKVLEVAEGDRELARGILATITVAAEFGVDLIKTIQTLALPKEELKKMYAESARFPNIFLAAIVLREVRQKRSGKNASK